MNHLKKDVLSPPALLSEKTDFEIELNRVPIAWDLEKGSFTFFGLDSALFWTDPSLVRTLAPLAEEIGIDLFRLLISHSSSLGTAEDYHNMVSTLGENFSEGFLAWGKAVSGAGWGTFELLDYKTAARQATVVVKNPWELSMQRNLSAEKRWGCPFLQGKIIGIFSHAFNTPTWAEDECCYDSDSSSVTFRIYPSSTTIQEELKKLRNERMLFRERVLTLEVEQKTAELKRAHGELEDYSKTLEQQVSERTAELKALLKKLEVEKEKLKESQDRLEIAFGVMNAGSWSYYPQTQTAFYSPEWFTMLGYRPDEFENTYDAWAALTHPEDLPGSAETLRQHIEGSSQDIFETEFRMRAKDGTWRWILGRGRTFEWDAKGLPFRMIGANFDITQYKQTQAALEKSERLFRAIFNQTYQLTGLLDRSGRLVKVNQAALSFVGKEEEDILGKPFAETPWWPNREKDRRELDQLIERALLGEICRKELVNLDKRRKEHAVDFTISPFRDEGGTITHLIVEARDITEIRAAQERLKFEAYHDSLTGLPNRSLLEDRIKQSVYYAMRSKRMVAVLLLDLDRFKRINDTLGHSVGDQLLMEVSRRLLNSVRECDTVARFGGDEFVIVLSEIAEWDDISIVTEKILETLSHPIKINHHYLEVDTSIGISCFPKDGQDAESLIQKADLAMYQAKQVGGNIFRYFAPEMTARAKEMLNMEAGLREGLKKNAFFLHYQPKVDVRSGHILGCEALVRWQHPEKGLLLPGEFIPVAEETGLILPLGRWILEEACRQANKWKANGSTCQISVNVSAHQFRKENFVQDICDVLRETDADPGMISLEITESVVMHDLPGAIKIMEKLKELGLGLQLDDFGTGFSNFNSLRKFKVDCLKIDRSFVSDALKEPSAAAVIQSIIAIAHNLGLIAVAEGVETQEQLNFLTECGCDAFQGFLFSKPLPADELASLLSPAAEKSPPFFNCL